MKNRRDSSRIAVPGAAAPDARRRRVLQGMLSGGLLALAGLDASAQSQAPLIALPRHALIIGNSKYPDNPLRNPANDAGAMAEALGGTGFAVARLLDAGRDQMRNAIQAYVDALAKRSAVGVFYFAGHGMQLAWRNYLIPVDAVVDNPDDVRERAVDLTSLLQGLTRAKNPMNVIILDACRDNPFGTRFTTGQKGLSQFDAPPGSLLAYATAPGNVAADGDGVNGLYTENLLREIRVPDAKIEDVFKRVRLHVRKKTNGQQIPWESTSLEEDFYFVPPKELMAAAEEELERERKRESEVLAKRRAEEEAERRRRQEQALREAKVAAEEAERKRQQELAALEQRRIAEEAELKRVRELALREARRVAEEAERRRKEEQALREARLAEEEAARKYRQELALREKQRAEAEAERKRKEEQALREAKLAQEEADRKYKQELASREKQREQEESARRQKQAAVPAGKPDAALAARQFEEELALWERIKSSKQPEPLEGYLLRYPSGRFAELAQLQLDGILATRGEKRVEIVSAEDNPFTKGSARAQIRHVVGDSFTYRVIDLYTKLETETYTETVTRITDSEVLYSNGTSTDLLGNRIRTRDGRVFGPSQFMPLEFSVGKRWSARSKITSKAGTGDVEVDIRITTRESITVPAGAFDAFRLEAQGWSTGPWGSVNVRRTVWLAPGKVRHPIAVEEYRQLATISKVLTWDRRELVSYRQA